MTALDLDAIKARADAATEGPWMADESHVLKPDKPGSNWDGKVIATVPDDEFGLYEFRNVEFIAHARTDVPALVAEVERLRKRLAVIRGIGARSGTDLNAWNKAFDIIDAALRGDSSSTGSQS